MVEIAPAHLFLFHVFFFNDTATTEIYTLSLHDALPISFPRASRAAAPRAAPRGAARWRDRGRAPAACRPARRSEEHTSELQSRLHLVCRLLLEKKKIPQGEPNIGQYRPMLHRSASLEHG